MTKPILFNTEMIRAILNGRKTCARRVVKKVPEGTYQIDAEANGGCLSFFATYGKLIEGGTADLYTELKPPYQVGDVLYVRETWGEGYKEGTYIYKADDKLANHPMFKESTKMLYHPSIYMPKEAARIWLKVTDVRVEQLQDITPDGAKAEGMPDSLDYPVDKVYCPVCKGEGVIGTVNVDSLGHMDVDCSCCDSYRKRFKNLWNSTIKSDLDRYDWEANPWVWVIEFARCENPLEVE